MEGSTMASDLIELKVPGLGESISEATIAKWVKGDGEYVGADDVVVELETDKATVELPAGKAGTLKTLAKKGDTIKVGDVIAKVDPSGKPAEAVKATPAKMESTAAPAGTGKVIDLK